MCHYPAILTPLALQGEAPQEIGAQLAPIQTLERRQLEGMRFLQLIRHHLPQYLLRQLRVLVAGIAEQIPIPRTQKKNSNVHQELGGKYYFAFSLESARNFLLFRVMYGLS